MKTTRLNALAAGIALALAALSARADVAAQWTSIATETVRQALEAPAAAQRGLAAVREAMSAVRAGGNGNGSSAADDQRRDSATAVAAFAVLEALYPAQREALEAQLAVTFSHIPETAAKAEGAALGRRIATDVVRAMNDR